MVCLTAPGQEEKVTFSSEPTNRVHRRFLKPKCNSTGIDRHLERLARTVALQSVVKRNSKVKYLVYSASTIPEVMCFD